MIILYAVIAIIALLAAIMAINTIYKKPVKEAARNLESLELDKRKIAQHLSGMIKIKTITAATVEECDKKAFKGFHKYLEKTYPLVHKTLEYETVNDFSLLYKWPGSGSAKKPFLMMAHMDVVPVDERTKDKWKYGAFSGEIADGYVWGRGAIDMKGQLASVMESVEYLIAEGFTPKRDIYIALGHDEESMGLYGAQATAALLEKRDIHFDFILDEGGVVMDGKVIGANVMAATIGICEKGYADIRLTAQSKGGHASRPPKQTAVGEIAKAIIALEKKQMKASLNEPLRHMLSAVGGYMKFPLNVIAANLFITKPLLLKGLAAKPTSAALVRTTAAPTMLKGSTASNVLAEKAEAVVNFRISPDNTVSELMAHIKKTIANDDIKIEIIQAYEPSRVSDTQSEAYRVISGTVKSIFGEYVVSPYPMIAATDSRWYTKVSDGTYLFQPFSSLSEDLGTIHAVGERLAIDSLAQGVEFFIRLVKNADE